MTGWTSTSAQLRALDATVTAGTLDAAARALHVTPSAISQRLKALEAATGRVLLVRSKPVQVTESGQAVLRLARQVALLAADAARELAGVAGRSPLPIALNADSMATWVLPALAPLAGEVSSTCTARTRATPQRCSARARVMAAVTADAVPVPGCTVTRLGRMRYRPMATAAFADRWFADGVTTDALAAAPVVVFDRKDDLQHGYLRHARCRRRPPAGAPRPGLGRLRDRGPARVRLGHGPAQQEPPGELVELDPDGAVDVVLYWQQWRLRSPTLDRVAEAVLAAARARSWTRRRPQALSGSASGAPARGRPARSATPAPGPAPPAPSAGTP